MHLSIRRRCLTETIIILLLTSVQLSIQAIVVYSYYFLITKWRWNRIKDTQEETGLKRLFSKFEKWFDHGINRFQLSTNSEVTRIGYNAVQLELECSTVCEDLVALFV